MSNIVENGVYRKNIFWKLYNMDQCYFCGDSIKGYHKIQTLTVLGIIIIPLYGATRHYALNYLPFRTQWHSADKPSFRVFRITTVANLKPIINDCDGRPEVPTRRGTFVVPCLFRPTGARWAGGPPACLIPKWSMFSGSVLIMLTLHISVQITTQYLLGPTMLITQQTKSGFRIICLASQLPVRNRK